MTAINSREYFNKQWNIWTFLGIYTDSQHIHKRIYWCYGIILNIIFTVFYPLHLSVLILRNDTLADDIKNLAISLTTIACSIKFMSYAINLKKMQKIEKILDDLDARVESQEELYFYSNELHFKMNVIANVFLVLYVVIGITAELSTFNDHERVLLYPGWFPFDWRSSTVKYVFAHLYQIIGICIALAQNYANETTPGLLLCLLAGHIKLLTIRVSQSCDDCENIQNNELELLRCIKDQINLYKLCDLIEDLIAFPLFIQILVSAVNICVAMATLFFFLNDYFNRVYYFLYLMAMILQIFPACYFSTNFQMMFEELPYAVFSSNWTHQSQRYKKHMILFAERALMKRTILAGGILRLNLDTYISACKGAYSLFAVFLKLRG